jgi:hypothetical protein
MHPIPLFQDLIIEQIKQDFHCEVVGDSEHCKLFAALRTSNETIKTDRGYWNDHVMDVWQLIAVSTTELGHVKHLRQWHIPRFSMARAWANIQGEAKHDAGHSFVQITEGLSFKRCESGQWFLLHSDGIGCAVAQGFIAKMREDGECLEKARSLVKEENGMHFLEAKVLKTQAGHCIKHESRALLEAIAFEKITTKRLSAKYFGIFSAYCTYRDFALSTELTDVVLDELLETLKIKSHAQQSPGLRDMLARVQQHLLGYEIWRNGLLVPTAQARFDLALAMISLTRSQRTQFILMNGMHGAPVFLCLAVIHGFCTFEEYTDVISAPYQADSVEEQEVRKAVSYMALFGCLTE